MSRAARAQPIWPGLARRRLQRRGGAQCLFSAVTAKEGRSMASGDRLKVYNPMGFPPKVTHKPLAPRLDTLDGKTVYLVDCRFDDSDVFLKQMQAWFSENMPSVKTVFKPISSVYTKDDPATWEEIKANGDAAVVGVGH